MVNLKVEKFKAKAGSGEVLNKLRAGRIANTERLMILNEIGLYAQKRYAEYVSSNKYGYDLKMLRKGLKFIPDVENFENQYYIDNDSEKLDKIAAYFENGTGLYNVKFRTSSRDRIRPKNGSDRLVFRKTWKGIGGAASVKGVRPIYMLRRTLKSIEFNRMHLQRQIRIKLGI